MFVFAINCFFSFLRYFIFNFLFPLVYLIIIFYKILILFFFFLVLRIYSKPKPCSRDFLLSFSKFSSSLLRIVRRRFFSYLKSKSSFFNSNSTKSFHNSSKLFKSINISFLNIRSLNNKSIHVFNLVSDSNLDFLALSETWHKPAFSPSLISGFPPFYSFLELARAS